MKLLLDTHIFLWFIEADLKLFPSWRALIEDPKNEVFLSPISIWEAIIKYNTGRLPLPDRPEIFLSQQRVKHQITSLALDEPSVELLPTLPTNIKDQQGRDHKDPFDRMMICQALHHGLTFVTVDGAIQKYPVPVLPQPALSVSSSVGVE
jgi:PIN domain nuclease of toxin-antitoxin system